MRSRTGRGVHRLAVAGVAEGAIAAGVATPSASDGDGDDGNCCS
jgi:hypothetical protein